MAERRGPGDGPIPISESLERVAARLSRADLRGLGAIKEGWTTLVGEPVALHASPIRLLDGVLTVAVDEPAWATQLRLLAGRLREPAALLGACEISRIEVVVRAP
jgi:predicted nucleic acid-binding Zn ribbon protein